MSDVRRSGGGFCFFFFQAEDGIRDLTVTGVQTCALPICCISPLKRTSTDSGMSRGITPVAAPKATRPEPARSEEHTSELQSQSNLVCRLLLEKKTTARRTLMATTIFTSSYSSSTYIGSTC